VGFLNCDLTMVRNNFFRDAARLGVPRSRRVSFWDCITSEQCACPDRTACNISG
jgi:hypothetical protein